MSNVANIQGQSAITVLAPRSPNAQANAAQVDPKKMAAARELEAAFLSEMLAHAGLDKAISGQSGIGGEAFSSFLVEKYAQGLAEKGGLGLAKIIYRQLESHQP